MDLVAAGGGGSAPLPPHSRIIKFYTIVLDLLELVSDNNNDSKTIT
jgi:hypothetical protein